MHGGSDDGAGDEENREDRRETSNGEEGVQGSHHTHSHVSTRTLHPQNRRCDPHVPACLYLSCGKAERCLKPRLKRCRDSLLPDCIRKRVDSQVSRPVPKCAHWEAPGRLHIRGGNVGQTLLCPSRCLRGK